MDSAVSSPSMLQNLQEWQVKKVEVDTKLFLMLNPIDADYNAWDSSNRYSNYRKNRV